MKTYTETIDWIAEQAFRRYMTGGDSPMAGRYETSVVSFVFGVAREKVFDDIIDKYNKLLITYNESKN